jgi:PPOX class probable F420-dependent enzyme
MVPNEHASTAGAAGLSEDDLALLRAPNLAHVATIGADGMPHVTVVWVDTDGRHVIFNTARSRAKYRNLRRDPRVGVSVVDRDRPLRFLSVQGVVELVDAGAEEHIQRLSHKYLGRPYPLPLNGEERVLCLVTPLRILRYAPPRRSPAP